MNREELKALGLTDEQIEKVMAAHGKVVNDTKEQLGAVTTERDNLKEQISERDKQLDNLSKQVKDNEELTAEIDRLKEDNKKATDELQGKLEQQAFDFNLEKALTGAGVRNPKAVKALLDVESIKLDGDKLLGLDTQLEALKESDDYLFKQEEQQQTKTPNIVVGGNPQGGTNQTKSVAEMSYQELADLKSNNPAQFAELTK